MEAEKLVMMLNQIAAFYRRRPAEEAAVEVGRHVAKYWEPRMREQAYAYLDAGGAGLDPNAASGLARVREGLLF